MNEQAAPSGFPWPPAEGEPVLSAFARTWRGASLDPRRFFAELPEEGSLGAALLYYLPLGIAVAGAQLFRRVLRGPPEEGETGLLGIEPAAGMAPLLEFLLAPLLLLVSLFLAAGVTHLLLRVLGGANRDFVFTTRVFTYSYSPQVLAVIPIAGQVIGFVWMVWVAVIGVREGHRTTTGRAAAAVLVPVVITLTFAALAAFIAAMNSLVLGPA